MSRPWLLAELTYADVKDHLPEVVVLPFGATEPHNLHLPYGADNIEADVIGGRACEQANRRGADTVCLPTVPYGTQTNQRGYPLSMNLNPSTLLAILRDLVASLENSGVRKCLILNSHGGNEFKGCLRELFGQTSVHLFLCNWYAMSKDVADEIFDNPDDHAGEMETSVLLSECPSLVHLERAADGATRPVRFEAVRRGWVGMTRPWHLLTPSTGVGDPRQASAEKGKRYLEIVVERIARFLLELSQAKIDESFPFVMDD